MSGSDKDTGPGPVIEFQPGADEKLVIDEKGWVRLPAKKGERSRVFLPGGIVRVTRPGPGEAMLAAIFPPDYERVYVDMFTSNLLVDNPALAGIVFVESTTPITLPEDRSGYGQLAPANGRPVDHHVAMAYASGLKVFMQLPSTMPFQTAATAVKPSARWGTEAGPTIGLYGEHYSRSESPTPESPTGASPRTWVGGERTQVYTRAMLEQMVARVSSELLTDDARSIHVSEAVIAAMVDAESTWRADAISPAGAVGLMGVMPKTAKLSVSSLMEPETNVRAGLRYFCGSCVPVAIRESKRRVAPTTYYGLRLALACYNGGTGRVSKSGGDLASLPAETRNYITRVLNRAQLEK